MPPGIKKIYVEVFDECSLTMDKLIAYGHVDIPTHVIEKGETYEDWYLLSGEQGEMQEGSINLVLSYSVSFRIILRLKKNWWNNLKKFGSHWIPTI